MAGATGYTGRELIRELTSAGRKTVAHVRPDSPRLGEWRSRFEALDASVDSTPWEPGPLRETLARACPTVVYALLGTTAARRRSTGGTDDYETIDYGLTHLLLEACPKTARFVYLSAAGVQPNAKNPYYRVRARLEREIEESGLSYTIARPSFITGPDRDDGRVVEQVGAALADAGLTLARIVGGKRLANRYQSTTASVLARALARIGYDPAFDKCVVEAEGLR